MKQPSRVQGGPARIRAGRSRRLLRRGLLAVAMAGASLPLVAFLPAAPAAAAGNALYGLRASGTSLVRFDSSTPGTGVEVPITGLPAGQVLKGIDVRLADGQLYGFSNNSTYRINANTGAASLVGTVPGSIGVDLGYDFDPVSTFSRVVGVNGANIRVNPDTGALAGVDTPINPPGFAIAGIAYLIGPNTLFGIDAAGDRLVMIGGVGGVPSANLGTTTAIGALGVNTSSHVGFDIVGPTGVAYASLSTGGVSSLYTVSLTTGAATLVGAIAGGELVGLAVGPTDPITRLAGPDRIDTAIATSTNSFPAAGSAPGVVLARSDVAADALAGTPLTKIVGGPLLLTTSNVLDGRTQTEMVRLLGPSSGRTVHLLGGPVAISDSVKTQIEGLGYVTVRHGGVDRFDTATVIATALGTPTTVFLADGMDFADALIAGVAAVKTGGAVLLTNGTTLPDSTNTYLTAHAGPRFTLGPSSTAFPAGTAIAGADSYDRSVSLATQFWPGSFASVGIASGEAFPDGLTGGAHIARIGGPLFLVTSAAVPASVSAYLGANHVTIDQGFLYGGSVRITDAVLAALRAAIS